MAWTYLLIAGILEIGWALGLKYSEGFSRLLPAALTVMAMIASFYFLGLALRSLPLGTAYAVWTGIGTIGTAVLGILLFDEPLDLVRVLCISLIVIGVVGLRLFGAAE